MTRKSVSSKVDENKPSETIVDTDWAEAMYAKGHLPLSQEQVDQLSNGATMRLPSELMERAFPPTRRVSIDWIEPLEAVHLLAPHIEGDANAKRAIAERLRDGAIECAHVWMSIGMDVGPISSSRPKAVESRDVPNSVIYVGPVSRGSSVLMLGPAFWSLSDDWERDTRQWDWGNGLFVVRRKDYLTITSKKRLPNDGKITGRMVASGVRFNQADIEKIIDAHSSSNRIPIRTRSENAQGTRARGKARNSQQQGSRILKFDDAAVIKDLTSQMHSGDISVFGRPLVRGTQAKVENYIFHHLAKEYGVEPGEKTVRTIAQKIMKAWREHVSAAAKVD